MKGSGSDVYAGAAWRCCGTAMSTHATRADGTRSPATTTPVPGRLLAPASLKSVRLDPELERDLLLRAALDSAGVSDAHPHVLRQTRKGALRVAWGR